MTVLSKATVAALFLLLASDAFGKLDPQLTAHSKSLGGLDLSKAQVGSLTNAMSAGSLKKVGNRDTTMATKSIGKNRLGAPVKKRSPSPVRRDDLDTAPTPAPTGPSTDDTTVHITDENDFALLLPGRDGELISDAESDGVAFCTPASGDATCQRRMSDGFISAAHVERSGDSKWIQVSHLFALFESSTQPLASNARLFCEHGGEKLSLREHVITRAVWCRLAPVTVNVKRALRLYAESYILSAIPERA